MSENEKYLRFRLAPARDDEYLEIGNHRLTGWRAALCVWGIIAAIFFAGLAVGMGL